MRELREIREEEEIEEEEKRIEWKMGICGVLSIRILSSIPYPNLSFAGLSVE